MGGGGVMFLNRTSVVQLTIITEASCALMCTSALLTIIRAEKGAVGDDFLQ